MHNVLVDRFGRYVHLGDARPKKRITFVGNLVQQLLGLLRAPAEVIHGHSLYLAEYELRYNHRVALEHNDIDRTLAAVRASEGKRLTYKQPREAKIPF